MKSFVLCSSLVLSCVFQAAASAKDLILNLYVNVPGKNEVKQENRDKLLLDIALHAFRQTNADKNRCLSHVTVL